MPAIVDAEAGQFSFFPDTDPERAKPIRREALGNTRSLPSARGSASINRAASGPDQTVRGPVLQILNARIRAVLAHWADPIPLEIDDPGKPRSREGQQADDRHRPRMFLLAAIQHRSKAFEFRMIEAAGDGPAPVPDDVGAGVGDGFAPISPHWRAVRSMARRISNARLAALGLSTLAGSNHAETRAWSMASSRSFPKCGIRRLRM